MTILKNGLKLIAPCRLKKKSAVKWLIAIIRIQYKSFYLHNISVCYYLLLCIYKYTQMQYFELYMYLHVYIYIH